MSENNNDFEFSDISSNSKKSEKHPIEKKTKEYVEKYGNGMFKHMGGIIKFIAFLICFTIIIASFAAAYFFYAKSSFSIILSVTILGAGTSIALIFLFMIYGMGHLICQNNEILTRLNKLLRK